MTLQTVLIFVFYRIKTSISDKLRRDPSSNQTSYEFELEDEKCLPQYATSSSFKSHVRATSILYAPFNVLVHSHHEELVDCECGYLCKVPEKHGNQTRWKCACCDGISIALFHKISVELDFTYDLYITEDGNYGGLHNGTWNGMVNELIQNKADIAVHGLFINEERLKHVDFTPAYTYSNLVFVRRLAKRKLQFINWDFVKIMHFSLAIAIVVSTVISVFFISLFENIGFLCSTKSHFALREVMTYIFGLTFQRDMGGRNPKNWSGRIVALGYASAMMIVMTTYTAHITATNISKSTDDDFRGLKDHRVGRRFMF